MEPYFGYGMNPQWIENQNNAKRERKEIRRLSLLSGGAILLYILMQNVLVTGMQLFGVYALYERLRETINAHLRVGCTACGYCMPCPQKIEINNCARMSLMLRRDRKSTRLNSSH